MKRGTEKVGTQMCLPLEEFLAERGNRSNAMRPLGEVVAGVMNKVGQRRPEGAGGRDASGQFRGGEERTPRKENGKSAEPEGPASFARAANAGGGTFVDFPMAELPTGTKHTGAGHGVVVMCFVMVGEAEHHACSGDEDGTWIPF